MGQTLTHGIYLPDEGERNCYAGLAANWQLLDGAVGTVASHTTALAGKAPLVHTHTKSDITDFPAYGTTAGTICEGNDSRLSDARTPVAHTHVTADITDFPDMTLYPYKLASTANGGNFQYINLENEGYIASGFNGLVETGIYKVRTTSVVPANPYSGTIDGILIVFNSDPSAGVNSYRRCQQIFYTNTAIPRIYKRIGIYNTSNQSWSWDSYPWVEYANTGRNFIPNETNSLNLGSSAYQWNNLYAKEYYYNGTAWGLDKENVWSQSQTISASTNKAYIINNTSYTLGEETPSSTKELGGVFFKDSNSNNAAYLNVGHEKTTGDVYTRILTRFKFDNGVKSITGSYVNSALDIGLTNSAEKFVRPSIDGEVNLGNSTHRWKTLNGINPGALSLPSADAESFNGDLTNKTGTTSNSKTWSINGWGYVFVANDEGNFISVVANGVKETYLTTGTGTGNANIGVSFPIVSGRTYSIYVKTSGYVTAYYTPTLGNI